MSARRSELVELVLARLDSVEEQARAEWNHVDRRTPTQYAVVDDFLPEPIAQEIYEAFPKNGEGFLVRSSFRERKHTSYDFDQHPAILADITFALQHPRVVEKFGMIIGIEALEPDPHLYAGGLSMMLRGDFLNPHIDNSHEKTRMKYRRMNALYYVSPDWEEDFGGNLELWDQDVTQPVTIMSRFNRLALMQTNKGSWHSVSPVQVNRNRCCVSNYYFTEESPTGEDYYHVTSFTGRPGQQFRRVLGKLDNVARKFAREHTGLKRKTDVGYQGNTVTRD